MEPPLGLRHNNPGNLRPSKKPWLGQTGIADGFCVFMTMELGLRALCMQLLIDQDVHGCETIPEFITKWAPPNENNTAAYIAEVEKITGLGAADVVDMHDKATLWWFATAIGEQEQGRHAFAAWVRDEDLALAIDQALHTAGQIAPSSTQTKQEVVNPSAVPLAAA